MKKIKACWKYFSSALVYSGNHLKRNREVFHLTVGKVILSQFNDDVAFSHEPTPVDSIPLCECLYGDGEWLSIILHSYVALLQNIDALREWDARTAVFIRGISFAPHPKLFQSYILVLIGAEEFLHIIRCAMSCGVRFKFVICEKIQSFSSIIDLVRYEIWTNEPLDCVYVCFDLTCEDH